MSIFKIRLRKKIFPILSLTILSLAVAVPARSGDPQTKEGLAAFFSSIEGKTALRIGDETLYVPMIARQFYEKRGYEPAWTGNAAQELLQVLRDSYDEGLNPSYYHLKDLEKHLSENSQDPAQKLNLEILLTDAFLTYAANLAGSQAAYRLNPKIHNIYWQLEKIEPDLTLSLETALKGNLRKTLLDLSPVADGNYVALKKLLKDYRGLAAQGGWPTIPPDPKPAKGSKKTPPKLARAEWKEPTTLPTTAPTTQATKKKKESIAATLPMEGPTKVPTEDDRVPLLRKRLFISGDLKQASDSKVFDAEVEDAVKKFQARHGLEETGQVGPETMAALNVPIEKRIQQIEANLERRRWIGSNVGKRFLHVNIPEFKLTAFTDGQSPIAMKVVTGQTREWQTPLVSSTITELIFNPQWHVPPNIIRKEMLRHIQKDPNYLKKQGLQAYVRNGGKTEKVDAETFDWETARAGSLSIIQPSGRGNALGRIKFMFKNPYDIYLHDTSQKSGFSKRVRSLSHGCVRVEKPMDLAHFVTNGDEKWSGDKIDKEIEKGRNQVVPLKDPINVHILYWTLWFDETGALNVREDIYGIDQKIVEVLGV